MTRTRKSLILCFALVLMVCVVLVLGNVIYTNIVAYAEEKPTLTITVKDVTVQQGQEATYSATTTGQLDEYLVTSIDYDCDYNASTANIGDTFTIDASVDSSYYDYYDITIVPGTLTVGKATVESPRALLGLVYDGTLQTGLTNIDTTYYTLTDYTATDAGSYTVTATIIDPDKYQFADGTTQTTITYSIARVAVTVTIPDSTTTYGSDATLGTATATGLIDGDTLDAVLDCTYTAGDDVGKYQITISSINSNYYVSSFNTAYVDVTPLAVDAPTALTGLVYNGQLQSGVAEDSLYTLNGHQQTDAGTYTATATLTCDNYVWSSGNTQESITYTIAKLAIVVNIGDITVSAGDTASGYSYTVNGLVDGDSITVVYVCEYDSTDCQQGQTYVILATVTAGDNYTVTVNSGTLTVGEGTDTGNNTWLYVLLAVLLIVAVALVLWQRKKRNQQPATSTAGATSTAVATTAVATTAVLADTTDEQPTEVTTEAVADEQVVEAVTDEQVVAEATEAVADEQVVEAVTDEQSAEVADQPTQPAVAPVVKRKGLNHSFTAKIILSDDEIKHKYHQLKVALMSYNGVANRVSWVFDSFNVNRQQRAKIRLTRKTLLLYLALDPTQLIDAGYDVTDVSHIKRYAKVPTMLHVKGVRSVKKAIKLIDMLLCECGTTGAEARDYHLPTDSIDNLIERQLIKVRKPRAKKNID